MTTSFNNKVNYPVFLPKTSFNIYANAFETEEKYLKFWKEINLYEKRTLKNQGLEKFILHDGPPYANGPIHIGHAENKIWKDVLCRINWQNKKDISFILGWDSHGLPIENAVEKELKKENIDKNSLSRTEFWDKCYDFSMHWMNIQKTQFEKLGICADFENHYATFFEEESLGIIECIHDFVKNNLLEQRYKPVLWSYVEKTALAYAEVEYKDKISESLYVSFPVIDTNLDFLIDAKIAVWTTTAWTLPANEAVAYNPNFEYALIKSNNVKYCVLKTLCEELFQDFEVLKIFSGSLLSETFVSHPISAFNNKQRKMIPWNEIDNEKGTGFVHIAPANGEEDYALAKKQNINIENLLDENGCYYDHIPLVAGLNVKAANEVIIQSLQNDFSENLIKVESYNHSYPHSWRSKAPLIFKLTKQWFVKMQDLKQKALLNLQNTKWVPSVGENRFSSMLSLRDDWCVSRQRIWGVPIAIFFNKKTNQIVNDPAFLSKTVSYLRKVGVKNWWQTEIADIDSSYSNNDYEKVQDILDVWFESGATAHYVLKKNNLFPANVYLEGSDQHRGWFQSSLLISTLQNNACSWKNLITHGFCLDDKKQKMSKSLGNVVDPLTWDKDELRLFFSSLNLTSDITINENTINHVKEMLFRFKNTFKFMLGIFQVEGDKNILKNISLFDENFKLNQNLPLLEKWLIDKVYSLHQNYLNILSDFTLDDFINKIYDFCSQDLSSFYFDIRKSVLYCNKQSDELRKNIVYTLKIVFDALLFWLSPFLPFLSEDIYQTFKNENDLQGFSESIHLISAIYINEDFKNNEALNAMQILKNLRKEINIKIEYLREQKIIATSSEIAVQITEDQINGLNYENALQDIKEIAIVSEVVVSENFVVKKFEGTKCPRCRFFFKNLNDNLCENCSDSLS